VSQQSPKIDSISEGSLLIADPTLQDGVFNKTVILLAQHHKKEGTIGFILNQLSGKTVKNFISDSNLEELSYLPVYYGGPVGGQDLSFGAFWYDENKELCYAFRITSKDAVLYNRTPGVLVRAFVGYSGWAPEQLQNKYFNGTWVNSPAPPKFLCFPHDSSLWSHTLKAVSPLHRLLIHVKSDPNLN